MFRWVPLFAVAPLAACVSAAGPLPKLSGDIEQPELALFEHVLTGHFAGASGGPRTCAALLPKPLTAKQEKALVERFVRLAPASQCGEGEGVVQVYEFACASEGVCSGWVARPGAPATRYTMRFDGGSWRFDGDLRVIAK
ncbi:hypothetical protein [Altererythrobacter sp. Root672]|uniref:hypothetical protein n=1 Tax=Altererythrobacter sp. Root672 TaxID=1736584 RepID=UPI000700542B|nr:hypothetical protein [Altererythrobacter sp. Root672]KRA83157.1 hypothetical protein ASD76_03545 [Altererythrobacter sp. Root672]